MNSYNKCIINKISTPIPIQQTSPTNKRDNEKTYSLQEHIFDPSKSSPPNEFMLKLKLRMNHYNSFNNLESLINE